MIRLVLLLAAMLALSGCTGNSYDKNYWGGISKQIHDTEK